MKLTLPSKLTLTILCLFLVACNSQDREEHYESMNVVETATEVIQKVNQEINKDTTSKIKRPIIVNSSKIAGDQITVSLTNTTNKTAKEIVVNYDIKDTAVSSDTEKQRIGIIEEPLNAKQTKTFTFNATLKNTAISILVSSVKFTDNSTWTTSIKREVE